ncbi:MAG TPA: KEOPS complex subunit Pcc1 [Thermoplasmata archaeon]|nr:KEOPS complex subunit Pcc1 [Thermoplasmata archaeon]
MKARARIMLTFDDAATADAVATSVSLDDDGYIRTNRRGRTIAADASAESAMSLLHTLDDYLACVSVAERTVRAARPRARGRRRRA